MGGGARPAASVGAALGAGGPLRRVRGRHPAVPLRLPPGAGEGPRSPLPGLVRPQREGSLLRRHHLQMGSRIRSVGFHLWKGQCNKSVQQCVWARVLYTTNATWYDSKCSSSSNPHDILHSVCSRVFVLGVHSVLRAEGILHCLRHHIFAELHSLYHQLQTTSLFERGLETATPTQTGIAPVRTYD